MALIKFGDELSDREGLDVAGIAEKPAFERGIAHVEEEGRDVPAQEVAEPGDDDRLAALRTALGEPVGGLRLAVGVERADPPGDQRVVH